MRQLEFTKFSPLGYAGNEAMNTLCTNLSFAGENVRKIMVTSCQPGEGKSYISMNLMRTFAKLGMRVVLVDADLRRSMIASRYGIKMEYRSDKGLTHYLAGKSEIEDVLYETNINGAYIVPVGREVASSLPLLRGPRLPELLDVLADHFDMVVVDAPPVGVIVDAVEISKSCDGTLFVIGYNKVRYSELMPAKEQIERAGSKVLGSVLNDVKFDSLSSRKYYYKSYYYSHYTYGYYKPGSSSGQGKDGSSKQLSSGDKRRKLDGAKDASRDGARDGTRDGVRDGAR